MAQQVFQKYSQRMQWWMDARFGVSYHWGLYSIPARGEWVRSSEKMSLESYRGYFDAFKGENYDPRQWAKSAYDAGMRYAILTTKHHDGFCLFDSALTQYKSTNTPARRDLVREYVEAFRAQGLKVGLYYSLLDWQHPDYPAWHDRQHPLRFDVAHKERPRNWDNYVRYLHGQVRELLSNYGKIDLLVFDFSYDGFHGAKWGADELVKMIRELQPDIVLNDRLDHALSGGIKTANPPAWVGDFDTCELNMPHQATRNAAGEIVPWELWITHNNSWGYGSADSVYKSPSAIIHALVNCVSKSGNLTLNFSPDATGRICQQSLDVQREIGRWMQPNAASIYGCGMTEWDRPDWGRFTTDGRRLFAHITEQPMGHLTLPGLRGKLRNARLLSTGAECLLGDFWNLPVQSFGQADDVFLNLNRPIAHTHCMPDPVDTVIAMDLVPEAQQAEVAKEQTAVITPGPFA